VPDSDAERQFSGWLKARDAGIAMLGELATDEKRRANDVFSFAAPPSLIPKVGGKIAQ
jgi:hypothetical protein